MAEKTNISGTSASGKTAIVFTFYKEPNYGAFLQAYAMQKFLCRHSVRACIYDYNSWSARILTILYRLVKGKKISLQLADYNNRMKEAVLSFQNRLNLYRGRSSFDLAVLGSDEIWNIRNIYASHDPFLFRKYRRASRTISYAACAGNSEISHFRFLPYARKGICGLDAVSVRDDHTEEIVKKLGRRDIVRVLDPVFLHDFQDEAAEGSKSDIEVPYLFIYSYGLTADQIKMIMQISEENNWAVIATGSYFPWAAENPVPDPFQWLSYVKNAEAVVTTTFHGTVFSILFNKEFAVMNESLKVNSLLKEMKLTERKVSEASGLEDIFRKKVDYGKTNKIVEQKRRESAAFILRQFDH